MADASETSQVPDDEEVPRTDARYCAQSPPPAGPGGGFGAIGPASGAVPDPPLPGWAGEPPPPPPQATSTAHAMARARIPTIQGLTCSEQGHRYCLRTTVLPSFITNDT